MKYKFKTFGAVVCLGLAVALVTACAQEKPSRATPPEKGSNSVPESVPEAKAVPEATEPAVALGSGPWTNRLAGESSPYLLQHAHNPVDWYPWGEEAFEKARKENKPIFLSVGYSTCHWCHVMEHESFENPSVAAVMNEHFVCVKVDREERPDVDKVYMTFVQASTGSGGWPMSVWLTPELKPIYGATYFPPSNFTNVLLRISQAWEEKHDEVVSSGHRVMEQIKLITEVKSDPSVALGQAILDKGYDQIKGSYEAKYGGFGGTPKFPRPVAYNFMLRHHARTGAREALDMTLFTLRQMAAGGMHDHLGGGFHRYSVDERWHVPHFEKMLYDQAQLVCSYLEAYQLTRETFFADTARDILKYVGRDLMGEFGQFYSAEDADSPLPEDPSKQAEGAFYVWEEKEIETILGAEAAKIFNYYHGVKSGGNVASDPRNEFPNKNILFVAHTPEEAAKEFGKTEAEIGAVLAEARAKLFQVQAKRPRPHLDDKTLTAWNGLMISAYARAYQVLGDDEYLVVAEKATAFVRSKLRDSKSGNLLRRYRKGDSGIEGYVDDYAFFIQALLDLYEASFDVAHLKWATELQKRQNTLFGDADGGGYFGTTGTDSSVLLRIKDDYDGAEPSPNSVAALNLLRLGQMTGNKEFQEWGGKVLQAFGSRLGQAPATMPQLLVALGFSLHKPRQIVVAGKRGAADTRALFALVNQRFIPDRILLLADAGEGQQFLGTELEFIRDMKMVGGKATAYVCENYVCKLPTSDLEELRRILEGK